jgi:hypothetical protein
VSTFGWLIVAFLVVADASNWSRLRKCGPHGVFGRCRQCEQDAAEKSKAEAAVKAEADARRRDIEDTYRGMDESRRNELTAIIRERAEREHLIIRDGDLEAAVVRMHRRTTN